MLLFANIIRIGKAKAFKRIYQGEKHFKRKEYKVKIRSYRLKILMVVLKRVLVSLLLAIICGLIVLVTVSLVSRKTPELGILNSKLHACPDKPNCLCSEYAGNNYIEPVIINKRDSDMSKYAKIISDMGGSPHTVEEHYLRAAFTTPLMRFVDDFELRLDTGSGLLHLRSASRVGHSDFGKNRQRIEEFKRRLESATD